jgi:hypothetical protein
MEMHLTEVGSLFAHIGNSETAGIGFCYQAVFLGIGYAEYSWTLQLSYYQE